MARKISWEHVEPYPIRKTLDGWDEEYSSVDEFKQHLTADLLSSEKCGTGGRCVFWIPETEYSSGDLEPDSNVFSTSITEKITHVLRKIASYQWFSEHMLVQFWAEEEVEGRCCLATLHQPFAVVNFLTKGASWLRKICMQQYYIADDAADEDALGAPGRVFRNGNPESSPDILLYSTKEFPLRDFVTGCGLKSYLALPIFDVHHNQCVGVLEFIYKKRVQYLLELCSCKVDDALQEVGLRSAHMNRSSLRENLQSEPQPLREITGMLDLAIKSVPQLHLAQVWVPCNQCANNSSCMMERKTFTSQYSPFMELSEEFTSEFVAACAFHNIQNGQGIVGLALSSTNKSYFCKNLSEFSISEYPMKHYAQRARFTSCFAICPRNKHNGNDICVFEFFLQPRSRDDASIQSILHLLLKIMEKELKSFQISTEQYLGVEFQPLEEHILVIPTKTYKETFSVLEFKNLFQKVELAFSKKQGEINGSWICWNTKGEESSENRGNDSSMPQLNLGTEGIKILLAEILSIQTSYSNFLIQFWAPKFVDNKLVLSTSEQPFALSYLAKGLCWYRKQCVQYLYYIGDGAKEEELGPPGRVFLNGRTESSPDSFLYSRREFPLRDYLVCSGTTTYLALPLFGLLDKQCVGVLEFVGFPFFWDEIYENMKVFSSFLQKYNMRCTHISCPSSFPIAEGKKQALSEMTEMLMLVAQSPQLQTASVWTPCSQCAHNNIAISCMERAKIVYDFHNDWRTRDFIEACEFHHPQIANGVIVKVIESESKLYFCEDLCSSSICKQPLAHYLQRARLEICFAICLKSSYTGNSLYVIEYFLSPHSTNYEYSRTLCFLLLMMKQMLKSFKVASGRQLGEELVFEVRELCYEPDGIDSHTYVEDVSQNITGFSAANQLTVEKSGGQCNLPLGFESVQYGHETEHQYSKDQIHFSGIDVASNIDQEQERNIADAINQVEDETQNITDHVNFEEGNERDRSSTSFHVSYEQLKSQFGKSRKDAAKNLGVSVSTFKRKCRDYSIKRWPSRMNNINNPSLFRTKVTNKFVENADHQTSKPSGCDLATYDFSVGPNISRASLQKTTEHTNTCQAPDVVIKAKFKDETLKFEFCVSRGVEKLMEEVGKRLNLKMEELKLKYVDEDDGDLISLTCDEDLHFYVKSMKSIGKTSVQVLVHLISE